jgi:hypothetical protein
MDAPMSNASLEERIAAAFRDDIQATDVAALITETEAAVVAAAENAELDWEKALGPIASPDAKASRAAMEEAEFRVDRLRTVPPRLEQRHEDAHQCIRASAPDMS